MPIPPPAPPVKRYVDYGRMVEREDGQYVLWSEVEGLLLQRAQAIAELQAENERQVMPSELEDPRSGGDPGIDAGPPEPHSRPAQAGVTHPATNTSAAPRPASAALPDTEPYLAKDECSTPDLLRKIANNFERGYFVIPEPLLEAGPSHWMHALRERADQLAAALARAEQP